MSDLSLSHRFAADNNVDPYDVRQMKNILNRLGYYTPLPTTGMTGIIDRPVIDALKKFQKDHNLVADGVAKPGSPTEQALNDAVKKEAGSGFYIWRTMRDDKVRSGHAERDGHVFSWEITPEGGHPGTEYNCRCWAEKMIDGKKPPVKKGPVCFEAKGWKADSYNLLKNKYHENNIEYPYLDSKGLVTVGIGFNVDNKTDFINMSFKYVEKSIKKKDIHKAPWASVKQKIAAYEYLKDLYRKNKKEDGSINVLYTVYKEETRLRLSDDIIKSMAKQKMDEFEKDILKTLPDFKCYPSPARQALMDMMYNMGANRFNRKRWNDFFDAVDKRDWRKAAQESHRTGISEKRNENIEELFRKAEIAEKEVIY